MSGTRLRDGSVRWPRLRRVRANLRVVIALRNGDKCQARVLDVSTGGMHLESERVPEYGEPVTVVVRLEDSDDWHLISATVRWVGRKRFGVAFDALDSRQADALAEFVGRAA